MAPEDPALARAAGAAALGHTTDLASGAPQSLAAAVRDDPDPHVRAAALGALVRVGPPDLVLRAWRQAAADHDPGVRRRAADVSPALVGPDAPPPVSPVLVHALGDDDVTVVEAAAWALGELGSAAVAAGGVAALAATATGHADALAREAAVAALGALGDPAGLAAILQACVDKPAVRRRAVLALAPYDGPEVTAALERALTDRDWQVRQAAEDLS